MIGITTSAAAIPIEGEPLDIRYAPTVYDDAVLAAAGLPVHLPLIRGDRLGDVLDLVDGIILSGGGDLDPCSYGAAPLARLVDVEPKRDAAECELVRASADSGTPVLGVCRGFQLINVAFGGTLLQDLEAGGELDHHFQNVPDFGPTHPVAIEPGSRLAHALGTDRIHVNSVHHQAVVTVPEDLRVSARSPDGVAEGLELAHPDQWLVGVQWHPEAMQARDPIQRRLFRGLVEAARR